MDGWQARIQGMIGSERTRSLPIMLNKTLQAQMVAGDHLCLKALSAAFGVHLVMNRLSAPWAQHFFLSIALILLRIIT